MEGTSTDGRRAFRVCREFECSRLEGKLLADAYERVLPGKRVELAQRKEDGGELFNRSRPASGQVVPTPLGVIGTPPTDAIGGLKS